MNELNFCYWLQGFFEINNFKNTPLTVEQVKMIKDHLQYVFDHKVSQQVVSQPSQQLTKWQYLVDNDPSKYLVTC